MSEVEVITAIQNDRKVPKKLHHHEGQSYFNHSSWRKLIFLGENFGLLGPFVKDRNSNPPSFPGVVLWSVAVSRSDFRKIIMRMSV